MPQGGPEAALGAAFVAGVRDGFLAGEIGT